MRDPVRQAGGFPSPHTLVQFDGVDAARDAWEEAAIGQDNVFSTWEWASAWSATYMGTHRSLIHAVRQADGKIVGMLPLYLATSFPFRLARFIGHGPADQLGPVCHENDRQATAAALQAVLAAQVGSRGLLLADRLRADEGWAGLLRGRVISRRSFPVLAMTGLDWTSWLAAKSSNLRSQAGRRERKLIREHGLKLRLVTDVAALPEAMQTLMALHRARWGSESVFLNPHRRAFYDRFTRLAAQRGWLRLWIAELNGTPAAAWLGFRYGGVEAYYQSGREPALDRTGVGTVLLLHTIREAFADGMREYRFLLGDEPYKRKYMSSDPGVELVAFGSGPLPPLAHMLGGGREHAKILRREIAARPRRVPRLSGRRP